VQKLSGDAANCAPTGRLLTEGREENAAQIKLH